MKSNSINSLWSQTANKCPRIYLFVECSVHLISICKFIHFVPFIDQLHRVQTSMCWEIIATVISVWILRTQTKEITNWWMVWYLLTVYLCSVRIVSFKCLSNDRIQRFQEHCYIVESRNCVCYDILEPLNRILSFISLLHVVRIHAAGHGRVFESSPGDHCLDGKGYPGEVEISTDNFFANNLDHFLSNGPDFIDLHLVSTYFSSLRVSVLMPVLIIIREKPP